MMRRKNGGYSGKTSLTIEIERYKDKETGKYIIESQLPNIDDDNFEYELTYITLYITGSSYYDPGKCYGSYENSYPPEGDTEIEKVVDEYDNDWLSHLTKSEIVYIEECIADSVENSYNYDNYS